MYVYVSLEKVLQEKIEQQIEMEVKELFFNEEPDYSENSAGKQDLFAESEDLLGQESLSNQKCASSVSSMHSSSEKKKPSFKEKLKYRSVLVGEPAIFQCKLRAYPLPQITWFHNNRQIPQSLRRIMKTESRLDMHSSSLEVKDVQERDSGSYKIFAINSEGSAESTASLLVAHGMEQNATYLEFLRKSERTREHIEHLVQKRRDDRLKVDLRCIGSPFDKGHETEKLLSALSPTKGIVRTISFETFPSLRKEFVYDKERVRKKHSVGGEIEKEALLDEEIKLKLQRLREAKKAVLEKRKVHQAQGSAEVQLASVRTVRFRDNKGLPAHSVCTGPQEEKKGSVFQTIEQINDKSKLSTMLDIEEMRIGNSNREIQAPSEEFKIRMEQIVGLSEPPQIPQELDYRSKREATFQKQKAIALKGSKEQQVPEHISGTMWNKKWVNVTYAQEKSDETTMNTKVQVHAEDTTKAGKKNPSPLFYVLLTDDASEIRKPEVVMSETITLNVNETAAVDENRGVSKSIEAATLKIRSLEAREDVRDEVTEITTTITEPPVKLESHLPKYLEPCAPFFIHGIESQEVNEGDSCIFNCDFQGYPHVTVGWYNNDKPLPRSQECTIVTAENHSMLTFPTVNCDQDGPVTCVIFNQYGTSTTSCMLKVKRKEKLEQEPLSICKVELLPDYTEEQQLSFAFNIERKDVTALGTDSRATLLLPPVHLPRRISDPDRLSLPVEIKITAPTPTPEQDEERKEIIQRVEFVPEEVPEEQTSAGVKHKFKFSFDVVHEPPRIIKELKKHVSCKEGDSVALECLISAEPLPIVTWFQNDEALIPTEHFCFEEEDGIYRLCIFKLSISDAGTYKCVAENKAGVVETICDVSVEPTMEIFSSNIEQTKLNAVQKQIKQVQEHIAKEHLDYYCESSIGWLERRFGDKAYSGSQEFHNVSTLDVSGEETCIPSKEMESQLPIYLNDVMKSLLSDETENSEFQIQKGITKGKDSKAAEEQKVAIISGPDLPFDSKLIGSSEQNQVKDMPFKEIKEQICTFQQELSAKETVDPSYFSPVLNTVPENHDFSEKDHCHMGKLRKNSQDISTKEKTSMPYLQSIHDEFQISSKIDQLDLGDINKMNLQEIVSEQQEMFRSEKEQTFRSAVSDKVEGFSIHGEKISHFGEEKERKIYYHEELIEKTKVDIPEIELKQNLSVGGNDDRNIKEQIQMEEPIDQYSVVDTLGISLNENSVYSNAENANKEQNQLKSEEIHTKEKCFVSEIIETDINKITESSHTTISTLGQDIYSSQGISSEHEFRKEANHTQESILHLEKKDFDLYPPSIDNETVVEKQEETVVKDSSDFKVTDTITDKIIGSAETEVCYSQNICKETKPIMQVTFGLKQLSPPVEDIDQNQENVIVDALNSSAEEKALVGDHGYSVSAYSDIELIDKKHIKTEYSIAESMEIEKEQKSMSVLKKIVHSDQEFSKANEPIMEKINAQQHSLSLKNDIIDLNQASSVVGNNSQLQETEEITQVHTQHITENARHILHSAQGESHSWVTEKVNGREHTPSENEDVHFKLAFLNTENVDQQQEEKLSREELSLKFLYSASEVMESFQGQELISTQEISNDSQDPNENSGHKEVTLSQEELQTQEPMFDLKAHAAFLSQMSLLKETDALEKEACSFNLKSAFEMMATETESIAKQLQSTDISEERISLCEELHQSYKLQVEGENSQEQKVQTEGEMSVAQMLKMALETSSISVEQEAVANGHCEHEEKISGEELSDKAFTGVLSEPTPLSQPFQSIMKGAGIPEHINSLGNIVLESDNFITDLKKAAHEKVAQSIYKVAEEKAPNSEAPFIKEVKSSSFDGSNTENLFHTQITPEEQQPTIQVSSDTSAKEPSLAQFLLSLKNEPPVSQDEAGDVSILKEQYNARCQVERQRETTEPVSFSLGSLNEEVVTDTTQEPHVPLHEGTDFPLTQYLLAAGEQETPQIRGSPSKTLTREGSITSLEVEDVTFSTVYDYYNQQQELTRPFSPESEMSIDIDSISGDEAAEPERFYTPPSSVENFESPLSFASYHSPVGSPERHSTPSEELYSTPSEERYSTPSEERYSTPSEERYSTPSEERYSTPSEERYSTPSEERYSTPSGVLSMDSRRPPANLIRQDTPPECYQTPTGTLLQQRSSSLDELRAEMFGTPCEALEPKENEMPPAFIKALTKRRIYENSTLHFIAEVIGYPMPDVKWYRNKSLLEQDRRVSIQKESNICTLEIHNIQKTEGGVYMCHAVNIIGEAKSIAQVEVLPHDGRALALPPPVTHQHVIEFDIEQGSASRTPSPQEILLEVELDETDIKECEKQVKIATVPDTTSDNQSMIVSLDVLPLSLVEHTMALSERENKDIKIDVEITEMPPRFTSPVADIEVPEKSEALFHCKVAGRPTPVVQWFKESKCIAPDAWKYDIFSENGSHSLKIQNVGHSDSGMYLCKAVNTVGEATCKCILAVTKCQRSIAMADEAGETDAGLDSPSDRPQKIDLLVDNTIQNGTQTEIELEFEFERDIDDSQKAVRLVAVTEQEQEEEGESCVNINFDVFAEPSKEEQIEFKAESTDHCSFEFQVTEAPPKFVKNISDCASFKGTSAYFQCLIVGSPKPAISWFKNGSLIQEERFCMEESPGGYHSLTIRHLVQNDEGEYKCVATNKAGTAHSSALLTIC
ncbi:Obscurin [Varanus komodoensis]|nr:Obscurin [Varanus komodoensis]